MSRTVTLRPYQRACVQAVLIEWGMSGRYKEHLPCDQHTLAVYAPNLPTGGKPSKSTVANLATGSGKTVLSGALVKILTTDPSARVLFLAHTHELTSQPLTKFAEMGMFAALEKSTTRASLNAQVVVASRQTLERPVRRQRFPKGHFRFAVADEAHVGSNVVKAILDDMGVDYRLGITGTAFRTGEGDLSKYFDTQCFNLGAFSLIGEGFAVPIKVQTMPINVDISKVHTRAGEYVDAELDSAIVPYFERIVEALITNAQGHQIVTFAPLKRSADLFAQVCRHHGLSAEYVAGDSKDRSDILRRYADKQFQAVVNSQVLSVGWDCPSCSCLLNISPTRSAGLYRQRVGRILRTLPGVIDGIENAEARKLAIAQSAKPYGLILDLLWEVRAHGLQGPAALLDSPAEVADQVARRLRENRSPEELEEIAKAVQREHERRLMAKLDWAKTQKAGLFDAQQLAVMAAPDLLDYSPFGRAAAPPAKFTRHLLERGGIDPTSVDSEGMANHLLRRVNQRRSIGADPLQKVARLPYEKAEEIIRRDAERLAALTR